MTRFFSASAGFLSMAKADHRQKFPLLSRTDQRQKAAKPAEASWV